MSKEKSAALKPALAAQTGSLYLLSALAEHDEALETIKKHLEGKVEVLKSENLGKKTLAYPINKHRELTLLCVFFTAEPAVIPALETELKHEEAIERFLLTTWRGDINSETADAKRRHKTKVSADV